MRGRSSRVLSRSRREETREATRRRRRRARVDVAACRMTPARRARSPSCRRRPWGRCSPPRRRRRKSQRDETARSPVEVRSRPPRRETTATRLRTTTCAFCRRAGGVGSRDAGRAPATARARSPRAPSQHARRGGASRYRSAPRCPAERRAERLCFVTFETPMLSEGPSSVIIAGCQFLVHSARRHVLASCRSRRATQTTPARHMPSASLKTRRLRRQGAR